MKQGLNPGPRDAGTNQLSYEATDIGSWSFVGSNVPVMNESTNEMIYGYARIIASFDFISVLVTLLDTISRRIQQMETVKNTLHFSLLFTVSSLIFLLFFRSYFSIKIKLVVTTIFYDIFTSITSTSTYATESSPECELSLYLKKAKGSEM